MAVIKALKGLKYDFQFISKVVAAKLVPIDNKCMRDTTRKCQNGH